MAQGPGGGALPGLGQLQPGLPLGGGVGGGMLPGSNAGLQGAGISLNSGMQVRPQQMGQPQVGAAGWLGGGLQQRPQVPLSGGLQLGQPGQVGGLQLGQPGQAGGLQLGQPGQAGGLQLGGIRPQMGTATTTTMGGLQLGQLLQQQTTSSSGGLQLGQPGQAGGLQLGGIRPQMGTATTTTMGGLQLGQLLQQQTTSSSGGLQLGQPGQAGGLQLGGLRPQMGTVVTTSMGGLQLGQLPQQQTTSSSGGLQLGANRLGGPGGVQLGSVAGTSTGIQLGTATAPAGVLSLGKAPPSTTGGPQLGTAPPGGGLQLGGLPKQVSTAATVSGRGGLQLGQLGQPPPAGGGLQLGYTAAASTAAPQLAGLQLPKPQTTQMLYLNPGGQIAATGLTTTTAPIAGLQLKTGAPTLIGWTGTTTSAMAGKTGLTTSIATTASGGGVGGGTKQYTYKELEDLINKWSIELQGQEKLFLREAQQINTWDRMLAENGDKITELNDEVERVKSEQKQLDGELELINSQQRELEEILSALEQSVSQQQPLATSHHADLERTKIYQLAESVDGQLRRMEQDLKEVIEQMNSSNTAEDEDSPMVKVVKILNAHADSLSWIDRNTALLRQKVDEVGKQTEQRRREQERSFRLAFDQ